MDLIDLVRDSPDAGSGVILDADEADADGRWMYALYETPGIRLVLPWRTSGPDALSGEVRLDFARDEVLPEAPVWTRIPRSDGGGFIVVQTASPELSLAWKLLWLHYHHRTEGRAQGKDLYDAVLLAEKAGMVLPSRLLTRVLRRSEGWSEDGFSVEALDRIDIDWADFVAANPRVKGTAEVWLRRLADSLTIA